MLSSLENKAPDQLVGRFLGELHSSRNFESAMDVLAENVKSIGFRRVCYSFMSSPRHHDGTWSPFRVVDRNYPNKWNKNWNRHSVHCPYVHACFHGSMAVVWKDVQNSHLSAPEADAWHYLADQELSSGVTIPIHLPGGRFAFVTALDSDDGTDWDQLTARSTQSLFLLAHHFHHMAFNKFGNPFPSETSIELSAREIECLTWAARGKTAGDVACILGRSVETVRVHLKRASKKLNAINRPHAIAKACQLGLIELAQ